jgi:hypothetical protein
MLWLRDQESIKALAQGMFENNEWLTKMGVEPRSTGMFQSEYPELPGSEAVRTWLRILPAFAESRQLQLADECGKGTSAGFAEAGALVPPTPAGAAPLATNGQFSQVF